MTTAQVLFSVALGLISLLILGIAAFVISTTFWGDRWIGKVKKSDPRPRTERT